MGSFSNPFGAVRAVFNNRCQIKRVQGVRVCAVIRETISDCIILTVPPIFIERAALYGNFARTFYSKRTISEIIAKLSQKYHFLLSNYLVISN